MGTISLKDINRNKTRTAEHRKTKSILLKDYHKIKRWEGFEINKHWDKIENIGLFMQNVQIRQGPFDGIRNAWNNQPAFVVGGSIAARGLNLKLLDGRHSIGVNHMIEYYDGFEWFIFQDHRFLKKSKYDLKKYKGKIFAHNSNPLVYEDVKDLVLFKSCRRKPVNMIIENGLYNRALTGICAVHLALISGANPVYLIGMDTPVDIDIDKIEETGIHYEKNYTGEVRIKLCYENVMDKLKLFKDFGIHQKRLINVCENGHMNWLKSISLNKFIKDVLT